MFNRWTMVDINVLLLASGFGMVSADEQLAWIAVEHTFRWLRCPDWRLLVRYKRSGVKRTDAAGQLGTLLFKNWSITASLVRRRVRRGSCFPGSTWDQDEGGYGRCWFHIIDIDSPCNPAIQDGRLISSPSNYNFHKFSDMHSSDAENWITYNH